MQRQQALHLSDGRGMVIGPQVDPMVRQPAISLLLTDDEQGRRLPAAPVAPRRVGRRKGA